VNSQSFEQKDREQGDVNGFPMREVYEVGVARFPREYQRHWNDLIDKRFALILLASFVVHFITVLYFVINPPQETISTKEIRRIQEQYANFVLDEKALTTPEKIDEDLIVKETIKVKEKLEGGGGGGKGPGRGSGSNKNEDNEMRVATAEGRREMYDEDVESRRRTRDQISSEVSSKGILGILSATGSAASGDEVLDILGDVEQDGGGNLDEVLNQLDGIKVADSESDRGGSGGAGTGGRGGRSAKGTRATGGGGGIDDLISERGTAKSTNVARKGAIVVSNISEVENSDGIKSESRDPDAVSAIVNAHNAAIQYCYQRELKRNPDLKGKLVIRFTIAPDGKVSDVTLVSSTLNNESVERCVLSRVKRWDNFGSIDPSKGDATFRQIYTFGY